MYKPVVIVGAGPAGAAAARTLSRESIDFALLDSQSFPRPKGCGGGLTPRAIQRLGEIFPEVEVKGYPVREISIREVIGEGLRDIATYSSKVPFFTVVEREEFDDSLLKSVLAKGGEFKRVTVREISKLEEGFLVEAENFQLECDRVIVAAGVFASKLAKLEPPRSSGVYHGYTPRSEVASITYIQDGYLWSFPENFRTNLGGGVRSYHAGESTRKDLRALIEKIFGQGLKLESTAIPHFDSEKVVSLNNAHRGLLFVGDSAGLVDGWLGEGIDFALNSGRQAALAVLEDGYKGKSVNERYLERLFPMATHLQFSDAFGRKFNADLKANLSLLKDRRFCKLFMAYLSGYVRSPYGLALKSFFVKGVNRRLT